MAVIGLKSGSCGGLRAFFLTVELNFFNVALRKVMTYWDLNRNGVHFANIYKELHTVGFKVLFLN